ncbi:MAG: hypothetical protein ACR2IP_11515 [Solirubrobacteraceae bacterium]
MAKDRPATARQQRRKLGGTPWRSRMPDQVDASVDAVQRSARDAMGKSAPAHSGEL